VRQFRYRPHVENLADIPDTDAKRLAIETERQILRCFGHD